MGEKPSARSTGLPAELTALLEAGDAAARHRAWARVLDKYSHLILHAAKSMASDYDTVMDRYAYALEQLHQDDFRRLRSFVADGRGKFTTWLTVVVRRLCLDHHRQRYGRPHPAAPDAETGTGTSAARKRLVDLLAEQVDVSGIGGPAGDDPEAQLRSRELSHALGAAVAALEPPDRLLLTMRYEDGLSAREIAEVMGFPTLFHVYRRINALLLSLRRALEERGIDDAAP